MMARYLLAGLRKWRLNRGIAINTTSLMKGVVIFMKIKFRNVDTGEIIEIDGDDFEAFDECMSHKNYQLIFD